MSHQHIWIGGWTQNGKVFRDCVCGVLENKKTFYDRMPPSLMFEPPTDREFYAKMAEKYGI
jgi:hypothetical protein